MNLRSIATPLTIGSFILVSTTGLGLFFELDFGLIKPAHEFLSLAFLAGALLHVVLHWKAIRNHVRTPLGKGFALLFIGLTMLAVIPSGLGENEEGEGRHLARQSTNTLLQADLKAVAAMTHRTSAELVTILQSQGIAQVDSNQSVESIAKLNQKSPQNVLALLLPKSAPETEEEDD